MKVTLPVLFLLLALPGAKGAPIRIFPEGTPGLEGRVKEALEMFQRGDFSEAIERLNAEAGRGDKQAQFALGRIYAEGSGVAVSLPKAEEYYRKAAAGGQIEAQTDLAILLLKSQRAEEAIDWLRKAARSNVPRAMVLLGNLSLTGTGMSKNPADAKLWLEKAAAAGEAEAMESLSLMHENGEGFEKNPAKALALLEQAAAKKSVKALLRLAVISMEGRGTAKDTKKALEYFNRASDLGSVEAWTALGSLHETGQGVGKNLPQAVIWYNKAAEAGDPNAALKLGVLYSQGGEGIVQDDKKAIECFERSAGRGQVVAMYNLGTYYEKGRGVTADPDTSLKWHLKSATGGLGLAQREIGLRYREGRGLPKDSVAAISWLGRAASSGDALGAPALADMLLTGEGGMPPDPKNAMAILTRASELGLPAAQVKLAEVYASGADGRADLIRAYALTMAAGKDFEPAVKLQANLEKKMSPEQLSEAQKEFQRLKAKPSTPAEPAKAQ